MRHSSVSWEITLLYFLSWNFIWFGQKKPIKVRNLRPLTSSQISPNLFFNKPLLLKVCKISAKTVQRSYASWHWRVIQSLKKNWLVVSKITKLNEEYGKFFPEHSKISKLGLWWDPFIQRRKCVTLKLTDELCVMTMKSDPKFEEELTCAFKIDIRNLTHFDPSIRKSNQFVL